MSPWPCGEETPLPYMPEVEIGSLRLALPVRAERGRPAGAASASDGASARLVLPGGWRGLRLDSAAHHSRCAAGWPKPARGPSSARPARDESRGGRCGDVGSERLRVMRPFVAAGWLPTTPPPTRRTLRAAGPPDPATYDDLRSLSQTFDVPHTFIVTRRLASSRTSQARGLLFMFRLTACYSSPAMENGNLRPLDVGSSAASRVTQRSLVGAVAAV